MAQKYPPYVNAYGKVTELLHGIKQASVPPKFTIDFISSSLGLKSSSYRAMIPLLKRMGFLDQSNVPTQVYKDYRDDAQSGAVLAKQIRDAYSEIYAAHEYAHKLQKGELKSKFKTALGLSDDDPNLGSVIGTFSTFVKLADFDMTPSNNTGKGVSENVADTK